MSGTDTKRLVAKEKLIHELRKLADVALYLFVFFAVFRLYTRLVLEEYDIHYFHYGLRATGREA